MNNVDYLKMNMESERKIALSLEEGLTSFRKNGHEVLNSIYSGAERVSWYTSCFFDNYQDVCQELKEEDKRMIAAINEVFTRKDVIFDMIELYTGHVLDNFSDSVRERIVIQVTGLLAKNRTKFSTKSVLSYLIAKYISESISFTTKIRVAIGKVSNVILTLLDFYSNIQKAALSARRLKTLNPVFYHILYRNNLEMLYFIIEPALQRNIGIMNTTLSERDAIGILRDMTK
ncbi:hypothetical protein [Buttiauxella agrestis]|uniref:hypothetical protein n=1 Tax=Buttiauxella agrestis TaxID=82977 RepID=UPI00155FA140|nr:hypothetical protein [Buttiauxella agrestis]BCG11141.1 hypothetical protein BADSM9389_38400 [Buttiauxella agrestis]